MFSIQLEIHIWIEWEVVLDIRLVKKCIVFCKRSECGCATKYIFQEEVESIQYLQLDERHEIHIQGMMAHIDS